MELQPFGFVDITPRTSGILDLWSTSTDGMYELRKYICGQGTYRTLSVGNYTDISMFIDTNTCIQIANSLNKAIHVSYRWDFGGGINALLVSTAVLYVFFLIVIGIVICIGCGFGGRIAKYVYDTKIQPHFEKDTCQVDPCIQIEPDRIDISHPDEPTIRMSKPLPNIPLQDPPSYHLPSNTSMEAMYIQQH